MLAEGGRLSSPEVGANVGNLFSNVVDQEQGTALQVSPGIRSPCKGAITENVGLSEVG